MDAVVAKSPNLLAGIQVRVREIMKAIAGPEKPGRDVEVPTPPGDPDEIQPDARVGDASPTTADIKEAKEDAAPPPPPPMEGGDGDGDEGGDGSGDGDGDEGKEKPPFMKALGDGDGFDSFGNKDMSPAETRGMEKAYGNGTGHVEPKELLDGGPDLMTLLVQLLDTIEDNHVRQSMVLDELKAEVAKLKSGQSVNDRKISKALEDFGVLATTAPKPRAFTKALPEPPPAPEAPTSKEVSNDIFRKMKAGQMSTNDAMAKARQLRAQA